ncbi:MAG: bacterial transcriptional activator domain-containing protein [Eggerthellaceae bacterium]|nr:bacterial transcriptional activator domain-containing protein [Eggerthellaceae bacterium]
MDFLAACSCNGTRPHHLALPSRFIRNGLLARMMRHRRAIRLIKAPTGFGKTCLCDSYAHIVFNYERTFWIPADSPCFIRELDQAIDEQEPIDAFSIRLMESLHGVILVIFEDVPALDTSHRRALCSMCQSLIDAGCEVIVTTDDANFDITEERYCPCYIGANDLLYSDAEIEAYRRADAFACSCPPVRCQVDRVPSLFGRGDHAREALLKAILKGMYAVEPSIAMYAMLLLQYGSFDDVARALDISVSDLSLPSNLMIPFISIDYDRRMFDASGFSVDSIVNVGSALFRNRSGLLHMLSISIANRLIDRQQIDRALRCIECGCDKGTKVQWLTTYQLPLIIDGDLAYVQAFFDRLGQQSASCGGVLELGAAIRLFFLSEEQQSMRYIQESMSKSNETISTVGAVIALLLMYSRKGCGLVAGMDDSLADRAHEILRGNDPNAKQDVKQDVKQDGRLKLSCCVCKDKKSNIFDVQSISRLSSRWCGGNHSVRTGIMKDINHMSCLETQIWLLAILLTLQLFEVDYDNKHAIQLEVDHDNEHTSQLENSHSSKHGTDDENATLNQLSALVSDAIERGEKRASLTLGTWVLYRLTICAQEKESFAHTLLSLPKVETVRRKEYISVFEQGLDEQIVLYRQMRSSSIAVRSKVTSSHHSDMSVPYMHQDETNNGEWTLHPSSVTVRVFGSFDLCKNGEAVDPALVRRRKVRALLALLVLNPEREFSCDRLGSLLWPAADADHARRNFYSIWSMLRKALKTREGTCPCLYRSRGVCRIQPSYIASDADEVARICSRLHKERGDSLAFEHLIKQLKRCYRGELLSGESDLSCVIHARQQWKSKIVDALLIACQTMQKVHEATSALHIAQYALSIDRRREDAHDALIRSYLLVGQRPEALDAWFAYRTFLSTELGLDPSSRTSALYERIINEV